MFITGTNFKYNNTAQYDNSVIISGNNSKISGLDFVYDGVSIQGMTGTIICEEKSNTAPLYDIATRGVHIAGKNAVIKNSQSFTLEKTTEREVFWGDTKYFYNRGTLVLGENSIFSGHNAGSLLMADTSTLETENSGVVICGSTCEKHNTGTNDGPIIAYNRFKNSGIMIFGKRSKANLLPPLEDGTPDGGHNIPSCIMFSEYSPLATELSGYIKLTEDCTILDKDGKEIIRNGVKV